MLSLYTGLDASSSRLATRGLPGKVGKAVSGCLNCFSGKKQDSSRASSPHAQQVHGQAYAEAHHPQGPPSPDHHSPWHSPDSHDRRYSGSTHSGSTRTTNSGTHRDSVISGMLSYLASPASNSHHTSGASSPRPSEGKHLHAEASSTPGRDKGKGKMVQSSSPPATLKPESSSSSPSGKRPSSKAGPSGTKHD